MIISYLAMIIKRGEIKARRKIYARLAKLHAGNRYGAIIILELI